MLNTTKRYSNPLEGTNLVLTGYAMLFPYMELYGKDTRSPAGDYEMYMYNLEGEFNKYFRLLYFDGNKENAYAVLTPDIMQFLMNEATSYRITFRDNTIQIYYELLDYTDIGQLQKLFGFAAKIDSIFAARHDQLDLQPLSDKQVNKRAYRTATILAAAMITSFVLLGVVLLLLQFNIL